MPSTMKQGTIELEEWKDESLEPAHTAKKLPRKTLQSSCGLDRASVLSKLFMTWLTPLLDLGYQQPLSIADMEKWGFPKADVSEVVTQHFVDAYASVRQEQQGKSSKRLVIRALWRAFGSKVIVASILFFCFAILRTSGPFLVKLLLDFITEENPSGGEWEVGVWLALGLFASQYVGSLVVNFALYIQVRVGCRMKMALMSAVFQKALRLNAQAMQSKTIGEVVQLMSVDARRAHEGTLLMHHIWMSPVILIAVLAMLVVEVGVAAVPGTFLMCLLVPVQLKIARTIGINRHRLLRAADDRVKQTAEGIRVVKIYAWEEPASQRVVKSRAQEMRHLQTLSFLKAFNMVMLFMWPTFVGMVTISVYTALGNDLTVGTAFTVLAYMSVARIPVVLLPVSLANFAEFLVSMSRLDEFFKMPELHEHPALTLASVGEAKGAEKPQHAAVHVTAEVIEGPEVVLNLAPRLNAAPFASVEMKNASFSWDTTTPALKHLSLGVSSGSLVGVVGPVGGGKTSLLSAILGEMQLRKGTLCLENPLSPIAFTSQVPWIQNLTVRDNITLGQPFEPALYRHVLKAAALEEDLKLLPGGDLTEIGERGINLSGGQKARVGFARALYCCNSCELFLFDDPLCAVDAHVAVKMFQRGVVELLRGKTRFIVLNSHLSLLSNCDRVLVVSNRAEDVDFGESAAVTRPSQLERRASTRMTHGTIVSDCSYSEFVDRFPHLLKALERAASVEKSATVDGSQSERRPSLPSTRRTDGVVAKADPGNQRAKGKLMETEDRKEGSVGIGVLVAYFNAASSGWGVLVLFAVVLIFMVAQASKITSDMWLASWSNSGESSSRSTSSWITIWALLVLLAFLLAFIRSFVFAILTLRASKNLHDNLSTRLMRAAVPTFFDVTPAGRILNRFSSDLDHVDVLLPDFMGQFLQHSLNLLGVFFVGTYATPYFLVPCFPVFMIFLYYQRFFRKSSRELKRIEGVTRSPVFSIFAESLNGASTLRAFRLVESFAKKTREKIDLNGTIFMNFNLAGRWLALRLDLISSLIIISIALLGVFYRETLDASSVGLALVYSLQLTGFLQWTVRVSVETENHLTAVERLQWFNSVKTEAPLHSDPSHQSPPDWPTEGRLEFVSLNVRYRPELPCVLHDVSLSVNPREKIGICGRTGSGKTTIMQALFRIVEPESTGSILIDGVDLALIGLHDLRSHLSVIPQDPVLFSGTLRNNLDYLGQNSDEDIWVALERAHLADSVLAVVENEDIGDKMPREENVVKLRNRALNLPVTEGGTNFSQGERQLVCIARALLRHSRVLILDEATSSVDSETDRLVQTTIRQEFCDCTVLTIAHRLDTIIDADRILVLEDGRVREYAPPRELLSDPHSAFSEMLEAERARDAGR